MRYTGPYAVAAIPSYDQLVAATTPARRALLAPLSAAITPACSAYDQLLPDVHVMNAIGIGEDSKNALLEAFKNRTVGMETLLTEMTNTLPAEHRDLCPYCTLDSNPDLDHFLPKEEFPEFALHSGNMIYICTTCNRKKSKLYKDDPEGHRLFMHPFFEPSVKAPVLRVNLQFASASVAAKYFVSDEAGLTAPELEQLRRHFRRLGLGRRYADRAQSYLTALKTNSRSRTEAVIRKTMYHRVQAGLDDHPVNGWFAALYRTIAEDQEPLIAWLLSP